MSNQPTVFGNHYFTELLAGGGAFNSDKTLLSDPETMQWVSTDQSIGFGVESPAYIQNFSMQLQWSSKHVMIMIVCIFLIVNINF